MGSMDSSRISVLSARACGSIAGEACRERHGDCDQCIEYSSSQASAEIGPGEGTIGQVWQNKIPAVCADLSVDQSVAGQSALSAGLNSLIAMPVMDENSVAAVVAWYV